MDRMSIFIEENLNGYNLPADTLSEIRSMLMKRFDVKFSEVLSPEGRLAMEQTAKRESESANSSGRVKVATNVAKRDKNKKVKKDRDDQRTKTINFKDTYERSTSGRLDGDITEAMSGELDFKKCLTDGEIENSIENIKTLEEEGSRHNTAQADTSKRHSVEKCLVWMEVHNDAAGIPDSAHSRNNLNTENDVD